MNIPAQMIEAYKQITGNPQKYGLSIKPLADFFEATDVPCQEDDLYQAYQEKFTLALPKRLFTLLINEAFSDHCNQYGYFLKVKDHSSEKMPKYAALRFTGKNYLLDFEKWLTATAKKKIKLVHPILGFTLMWIDEEGEILYINASYLPGLNNGMFVNQEKLKADDCLEYWNNDSREYESSIFKVKTVTNLTLQKA